MAKRKTSPAQKLGLMVGKLRLKARGRIRRRMGGAEVEVQNIFGAKFTPKERHDDE